MRVILFQNRFPDKIRDGSKKHTIRKKAGCKPGDILSLRRWTGRPYRSKQESIINIECIAVSSIYINYDKVLMDDTLLDLSHLDRLAIDDGFKNFSDMTLWFAKTHGLPFSGYLIKWKD
jgi:uncharacterized protein YqfB (UPF0267 family)